MNFFKSVFSDDPDPPTSPNPTQSQETTAPVDESSDPNEPDSNPTAPSDGWSFGGLVKTLQVKSDWIETYRRDLEEFSSGLRKETEILREVASKAVKDLPNSIEMGASKAQTSLESVGQAVDSIGSSVWKSTAEIISQGKDSLLASADSDSSDASDFNNVGGNFNSQSVNSGRYNRFDAQLRAIQCDVITYIEEPDDVNDYNEWKSVFDLDEKEEEIECLMRENGSIDGIYKRVVPNDVGHDVFWSRYYYRVHRLKQADHVRAKLVKRAISTEDEEELSWDVDDEDEEGVNIGGSTSNGSIMDQKRDNEGKKEDLGDRDLEKTVEKESKLVEGSDVGESKAVEPEMEVQSERTCVAIDGDIDAPVVSAEPSAEEDDMGWDEIGDVGSDDEKKATQSGSLSNRAELQKRLSVAVEDDDEDLSWDIEDDDEPVKA